jgi:shikimate dehydrogenase
VMNEMARAEIKGVGFSQMNTILPNADMLVNTTSLGMDGSSPLELDVSLLPITACVSDIVYTPLKTKLLGDAENRGLRTIDGLGMLLHQAVSGFEKWFNFRPQVTSQLRELIIADLNREA